MQTFKHRQGAQESIMIPHIAINSFNNYQLMAMVSAYTFTDFSQFL